MTHKEKIATLTLHAWGLSPTEMTEHFGGVAASTIHGYLIKQGIRPNTKRDRHAIKDKKLPANEMD